MFSHSSSSSQGNWPVVTALSSLSLFQWLAWFVSLLLLWQVIFFPPLSVVIFSLSCEESPKFRILILRNRVFCCFSYCVKVKAAQSCPALCDPINYTIRGILQARILEWVAFPFSRGSSQPRDWTQVSCIAGRFFPSWATRETQENTAVGSLSLLQWIFPTQESTQGLLHCRQILYQLRY